MGNRPPIGRAEKVWVEDRKLMADVIFDQQDSFARDVERKYREHFLNSVSVGFDVREVEPPKTVNGAPRVTKAVLLDISAVNVPGDPNALMERQKRAYHALGSELIRVADLPIEPADPAPNPDPTADAEADAARASWDDVSADMARLYRPHAQGPDDAERKRTYAALARAYQRHGKTPPEFVPATALDALDVDTIRALFLEGEPELHAALFAEMGQRKGAVLSARNVDDLTRAVELINGVLSRSKKEQETQDEPERSLDPLAAIAAALGVTQ